MSKGITQPSSSGSDPAKRLPSRSNEPPQRHSGEGDLDYADTSREMRYSSPAREQGYGGGGSGYSDSYGERRHPEVSESRGYASQDYYAPRSELQETEQRPLFPIATVNEEKPRSILKKSILKKPEPVHEKPLYPKSSGMLFFGFAAMHNGSHS